MHAVTSESFPVGQIVREGDSCTDDPDPISLKSSQIF